MIGGPDTTASSVGLPLPPNHGAVGRTLGRVLLALLVATGAGVAVGLCPPLAFLLLAVAMVLFATRRVETLAVVVFWTLPYMSVNLPTGNFTLKMSDAPAYLFAVAWLVRAAWRRERVALPPATAQVLVYLAVLAVSAGLSPEIPTPFRGDLEIPNRNAPELRSLSLIIWLGLSWLVVTGLYNIAGGRVGLYRRCVRAHILSSGVACLISLGMFVLGLRGYQFVEKSGGRNLVFDSGTYFRLAGVAYEPLFLGFYLITVIPVTIAVLVMRPSWMAPWLLRLILALQCAAMFLTFSAGGWAGLCVVLLLLLPLLWPYFSRRSMAGMLAGAALAVVIGAAVIVTHPKWQNIATTMGTKVLQGGDDIRKGEWKVGYALIAHYPVLGVGPGMARFYFSRYHDTIRSMPFSPDYEINNAYINVYAESGLVGLLAFVWCAIAGIAALALVLRRFGPRNVPVLAALCASLVGCATQYASFNALFLVYFPVLIGLATAGARLAPAGAERLDAPSPRRALLRRAA